MYNIKYLPGLLIAVCLGVSCKKSDSYDVKGEVAVKFYTNNESPGNAPINSINFSAVNIPDGSGAGLLNLSSTLSSNIKFPVFATKPVSEEVTISAEVDNLLVEQYNKTNNTSYAVFPAGIFNNPTGLNARIPKGATISEDSISLSIDLNKLNLLTEKRYMAPVKLTTVSKQGVGEITTSSTRIAYVVVEVELRRIKYNATAAEAMGALISPRSSWDVIFTPDPSPIGNITDGSTTTYSRWGSSTMGQVDVNLQALKNVTGIRIYTTNSATLIPTQVDVYLSSDGINYDYLGSPLRANLTFASNYNYILFYKAIGAKYIRLNLYYSTSTNTQNRRITEFDVYAN